MKKLVALSLTVLFLGLGLTPVAHADAKASLIDLNKAGVDELRSLPRIGPAIAQRIVEYREKNGPFHKAEELINVRGIGEATFKLVKDKVTVSGEAAKAPAQAQAQK